MTCAVHGICVFAFDDRELMNIKDLLMMGTKNKGLGLAIFSSMYLDIEMIMIFYQAISSRTWVINLFHHVVAAIFF